MKKRGKRSKVKPIAAAGQRDWMAVCRVRLMGAMNQCQWHGDSHDCTVVAAVVVSV